MNKAIKKEYTNVSLHPRTGRQLGKTPKPPYGQFNPAKKKIDWQKKNIFSSAEVIEIQHNQLHSEITLKKKGLSRRRKFFREAAHCNSGGAPEIHFSGGGIKPQNWS